MLGGSSHTGIIKVISVVYLFHTPHKRSLIDLSMSCAKRATKRAITITIKIFVRIFITYVIKIRYKGSELLFIKQK